ncbi:hypothetical protein M413DRAFT_244467 [Hebeloma cylindrosporum]|uniref:Uncharacterized protein n=1 Tax=Hebeloma cylindrosporum TaxID=76867 RepID=A0A0C2XKM9_HEBCY|nr:hypothetical protein M413DRAFT_244467 [Hebeloma cylindrosporum h7]
MIESASVDAIEDRAYISLFPVSANAAFSWLNVRELEGIVSNASGKRARLEKIWQSTRTGIGGMPRATPSSCTSTTTGGESGNNVCYAVV